MTAPARILLVRTSSLGDVVQAVPVLNALRRALPQARLGWVVEEAYAPLLAGHPALDDLIVVALRRWGGSPQAPGTAAEIGRFLGRLADFGAEVAIDLMGSHKGAVLAALSLAGRRIGLARRARREPSSAIWINEPVDTDVVHAVDRQLTLLRPLGVAPEPVDFSPTALLSTPPAALPPAVAAAGPYFFLHPGAAWGNKSLPAARWAEVVADLRARSGIAAWIGAAPGEERLAAEIAASCSAGVVAAPDLPALGALLRGARLVLGGDTGPIHLADALGTSVVALFGPTDPRRHGPYRGRAGVVSASLPCSFCHRRMEAPRPCIEVIPVAAIVACALAVLADTPR